MREFNPYSIFKTNISRLRFLWQAVRNTNALVERIDSNLRDNSSTFLDLRLDTLFRLRESDRLKGKNRIAFVSILPPETSGIATYSLYGFSGCSCPFDLFTYPVSRDGFLLNDNFLRKKSVCSEYHLDYLTYADSIFNYKKIVIAIGNSNHHFYIWQVLRKLKECHLMDKVVLYLHDIFLHNICVDGRRIDADKYIEEIQSYYKLSEKNYTYIKNSTDKWDVQRKLIELEITGLRVFQHVGIEQFLVNSNSAFNWLKKDLDQTLSPRIAQIFLPLINDNLMFPVHQNQLFKKQEDCIYIGTFGVVSDAKNIKGLISAVNYMNSMGGVKGKKLILLIAGWQALAYFKTHSSLVNENMIIIDSPSNSELIQIMGSVDVAVQLRQANRGESSGIVPMLIQNKVPTLVSKVGAFVEYGDAVLYVDTNESVEIAKKIEMLLDVRVAEDIVSSMQKFIESHSPVMYTTLMYEQLCNL